MALTGFKPDVAPDEDEVVAEINITPLTDIFLVLLIIFMVTSTALSQAGLGVTLPEAKATSPIPEKKRIIIRLTKEGTIELNGRIVVAETLDEELGKEVSGDAETTVVMEGDEEALLGQAVRVLDAAKRAGASRIAIATRPPPKETKP